MQKLPICLLLLLLIACVTVFGQEPEEYICGNNITEGNEYCDGDILKCESSGYSGKRFCNSKCDDYGPCISQDYCGDEKINGFEECDGRFMNYNSCFTLGYGSGDLACTARCKLNTSGCKLERTSLIVGAGNFTLTHPTRLEHVENSSTQYFVSHKDDLGEAEFTFYTMGGTYMLWAEIGKTNHRLADSLFFGIDDNPKDIFDNDRIDNYESDYFYWRRVALRCGGSSRTPLCNAWRVNLTPGYHTLQISTREPGTRIRKLIINKNFSLKPRHCHDRDHDMILDYSPSGCPAGQDKCIQHISELSKENLHSLMPTSYGYKFVWDEASRDFTNVTNLTITNFKEARISFHTSVNLLYINLTGCIQPLDLNKVIHLSNHRVSVHSRAHSPLNVSATITFYNTSYNNPHILKDAKDCPEHICTLVYHSKKNGSIQYNVSESATYTIIEQPQTGVVQNRNWKFENQSSDEQTDSKATKNSSNPNVVKISRNTTIAPQNQYSDRKGTSFVDKLLFALRSIFGILD